MSLLNSITRLTWLSPTVELKDTRLASLRLGADMMVTSVGVQGACASRAAVLSEASGNKRKLACPSTHGGWKLMQKLIPQTCTMHMCVCSDPQCFVALPNCCVWLLACSHATTTREPKLHHRCHEPVTTAHGCSCDRLLLPRAGLAAQDARLRGCRRLFGAAAGLLPPVVAAGDSISVTHL